MDKTIIAAMIGAGATVSAIFLKDYLDNRRARRAAINPQTEVMPHQPIQQGESKATRFMYGVLEVVVGLIGFIIEWIKGLVFLAFIFGLYGLGIYALSRVIGFVLRTLGLSN
ncbi:MAG TPA: hypothetical protein VF702_07465 [Allosphingosinicella sp.]|jgi:hypothetical protein